MKFRVNVISIINLLHQFSQEFYTHYYESPQNKSTVFCKHYTFSAFLNSPRWVNPNGGLRFELNM